jgi:SAM-dependent methyltransferase
MTRYEPGPCPACTSPAHVVIAERAANRDEIELLWAFHSRRLRETVPVDSLRDRVAFSQDPPLRLVRCTACGLLYRNPREREEELVDLYGDEEPDEDTLDSLFRNQLRGHRARVRRLSRIVGRAGTGLEVGSYVGAFLEAAAECGWRFEGVDVNGAANDFARRRGLIVCDGVIADAPARQYDAVVFWNCFDQLPDPRASAFAARERLGKGGCLAVRVPNGDFYVRWRARLHSPLRAAARSFLAHSNLLGFPYRHGFSERSLRALLERAGFRIERVLGDALVPVADRWTRPWARAEESAVRSVLRRLPPAHAPWLEVYARAR